MLHMERLTLDLLRRSSVVGGCRLRTPVGACNRPVSKRLFFQAHSTADDSNTYHMVQIQTPIICSATRHLSGNADACWSFEGASCDSYALLLDLTMFIELVKDDHVARTLLCAETRSRCQACVLEHLVLVGTYTEQNSLLMASVCIVSIDSTKLLRGLQRIARGWLG